jgi:hypothetical protein
MVKAWSKHGQSMVKAWSKHGQSMVKASISQEYDICAQYRL